MMDFYRADNTAGFTPADLDEMNSQLLAHCDTLEAHGVDEDTITQERDNFVPTLNSQFCW